MRNNHLSYRQTRGRDTFCTAVLLLPITCVFVHYKTISLLRRKYYVHGLVSSRTCYLPVARTLYQIPNNNRNKTKITACFLIRSTHVEALFITELLTLSQKKIKGGGSDLNKNSLSYPVFSPLFSIGSLISTQLNSE